MGVALQAVVWVAETAALTPKSLVIGIDGLGYGQRGLGVAATPWIDRLIQGTFTTGYRGGSAADAFAGGVLGTPTQQPTVSGPGWSTILTGVWANRHNVTNNSFTLPNYTDNPMYLATLKEGLPSLVTASYVNWDPIDTAILSSIAADDIPENDLDYHNFYPSDQTTAAAAAAGLSSSLNPDAVFIHFDEVDIAGHRCGSSGACYQQELQEVDALVGVVLTAVKNRSTFVQEDWQIVLTSDHGHVPSGGHGGQSALERRIPFIVASRDVRQGSMTDPVLGVSHADVAPTVLDHFGIAAPAWYAGGSRALGGGVEGVDLNGDGVVSSADWTTFLAGASIDLTGLTPVEAYLAGDLDLDGEHDLDDFVRFRTEYAAAQQTAGSTVPEPPTAAMLVAISVAIVLGRSVTLAAASPR